MKQTGLFIVVQRRRGLGKFLERQIEKAARISASRGFWARCEVHTLGKEVKKGGTYSGIHASGFRDFLLKPELLRAVIDCGFEHPSEVQHECIPQAILGMDVLCQAKSGMGKTAVFVLSTLHQLEAKENTVGAIVLCKHRNS